MRIKRIAAGSALAVLGAAGLFHQLFGQATPASPSASPGLEFPVIMRQKVTAGTTPVGTKVEAKLALATLVDHEVISQDAILSGEVTESVAKSAGGPSRLGIRMDSAHWKNGSLAIKVYLTAWFYPISQAAAQDLSEEEKEEPPNSRPLNVGMGHKSQPARSYPSQAPDTHASVARPSPASSISNRRVLMKDVESTRQSDGAIALSSQRSNIKLDKTTTYVMAAGDLAPQK